MSLENNIYARNMATALIDLAGDQPNRFWEVLIDLAQQRLPPKPIMEDPFAPMSDVEARRFESQAMPFGAHKGAEIWRVPVHYLLFLTEGSDFTVQLKRYVRSARFQSLQEMQSPSQEGE